MVRDKEEEEFICFIVWIYIMEIEDEIEEVFFWEMFVDFKVEFLGYDDDDIGIFIVEMDDRRVEVVLKEKEKVVEDVK